MKALFWILDFGYVIIFFSCKPNPGPRVQCLAAQSKEITTYTFALEYDIKITLKKTGKRRQQMKKLLAVMMVLVFCTVAYAGVTEKAEGGFKTTVTDKVQKMMDSDQQRYEKSYAPRDQMANQMSLKLGYALVSGIGFSRNINELFAIGVGVGYAYPGVAADLNVTYYILPTSLTPYISGGIVAYSDSKTTVVGAEAAAGIDYVFDGGLGMNIGACWVKTFDASVNPFANYIASSTNINKLGLQVGLNVRY
jgi:hypothetical protein